MSRALKLMSSMSLSIAFVALFALGTGARAEEAKKETGSVSGAVVDKDGSPAPAVQVRLFHPFERGRRPGAAKAGQQNADATAAAPVAEGEDKPATGDKPRKNERPKPVATTSTDKDGKFTLADVPVGKYVVVAMVRGVGGARQDVEVTAGGDAKVDLKLAERPAKGGGGKKAQKKAGDAPAAE